MRNPLRISCVGLAFGCVAKFLMSVSVQPSVPGLVYFPDSRPGISRRRSGRGFSYYAPDGTHIADRGERRRLNALAVPPAYEDVWISPLANGHLQATGRDARGRKQYRYHEDWAAHRAGLKYRQLVEFGQSLGRLRAHVARKLGAEPGSFDLALATVLALIDRTAIRVGNPEYARENKSYGATTILSRHVRFDGGGVSLSFPTKGGKRVRQLLRGSSLQRALQRIHDLPGKNLVQWIDEDGARRALRSEHVNETIEGICGAGMTAKTFRTWHGTLAAFRAAWEPGPVTIRAMTESAAERLANTPTIARSSYVHPAVIGLTELDPEDRLGQLRALPVAEISGLRAGEGALLSFLETQG